MDLNTHRELCANGQYVLKYSWDTNRFCARLHLPTHLPPPPLLLVKRRTDGKQFAGGSGELGACKELELSVSFLIPHQLGILLSYCYLSFAICSLKECWIIFHGIHGPHFIFHSFDDGHLDCFHVLASVDGGILLSHEKKENCAKMCMNLKTLTQSNRKEKNKYRIVPHICGIQKNGMDEPIYKAETETEMARTNVQTPRVDAGHEQGAWK